MIKGILSISGKPGLYRLVNRAKNALIVESLLNGRRGPVYAHEKVISLADIAIYTTEGDMPLADVLQKVYDYTQGQPIDVKGFKSDAEIRGYFEKILPEFDQDRVYTTDIKKLFAWYNQLIGAGVTQFKDEQIAEDQAAEAQEAEGDADTAK